ncbi:hypothetical protein HanIR_Chr14g0699231 [Helianthus annuus]|nr:hypothetical protein HanIR_Chr14g0699231 [Helianthus annuus]
MAVQCLHYRYIIQSFSNRVFCRFRDTCGCVEESMVKSAKSMLECILNDVRKMLHHMAMRYGVRPPYRRDHDVPVLTGKPSRPPPVPSSPSGVGRWRRS